MHDERNQALCDHMSQICEAVMGAAFVTVDLVSRTVFLASWFSDYGQTRSILVTRSEQRAATSTPPSVHSAASGASPGVASDIEPRGVSGEASLLETGEEARASLATDPRPADTVGASLAADADDPMGVDDEDARAEEAHELEMLAAEARMYGVSVPAPDVKPMTKVKGRFEKFLEKMIGTALRDLGDCGLTLTNVEGPVASQESVLATASKAWPVIASQKYEAFARRVLQFASLNCYGYRLEAQMSKLKRAEIGTVLAKYEIILFTLGWTACFVPSSLLEVACRREKGLALNKHEEAQFQELQELLNHCCKQFKEATKGSLRYDGLRKHPITIFGTFAAGTITGGGKSPGRLLQDQMDPKYENLEVETPVDDALSQILICVKQWVARDLKGWGEDKPRSVHVFWSLGEYWEMNPASPREDTFPFLCLPLKGPEVWTSSRNWSTSWQTQDYSSTSRCMQGSHASRRS